MIRKTYQISEEEIEIINRVRERKKFLENDSATIRYIITQYGKMKELEDTVRLIKKNEIIQKNMEEMLECMYDALNTMLVVSGQEVCYPASYVESPVYTKSREYKKEILAKVKQKKDDRDKDYRIYKREKSAWEIQEADKRG